MQTSSPSTTSIASNVDTEFDNSGDQFSISVPLVEQYLILAESLAASADPLKLSGCDPAKSGEATCVKSFLTAFGRRAFRRPLEQDEIDSYTAHFTANRKNDDYVTSVRTVLTRMLTSPAFLHHVELGLGPMPDGTSPKVTSFELASRVSYLLWESMPDGALLSAAESGTFTRSQDVATQVTRMLADPRAHETVSHFHSQWLQLKTLDGATKDATMFPGWAAAEPDVILGTLRFIDDVLWNGAGDLNALLTSPRTFANANMAKLYGLAVTSKDFVSVDLDPNHGAGLLTQPAFLAALGKADKSSPILRGVFILRRVMCNAIPPPPPDVNKMPSDAMPGRTTREFFAALTSGASCQACHGIINPIGFGLEHFDAIGVWREAEGTYPIDATGTIKVGDQTGAFNGAADLAQKLAASSDVKSCMVKQWFRYGYGRTEVDGDAATLKDIETRFVSGGSKLLALPQALTESEAFYRLHYTTGVVQ